MYLPFNDLPSHSRLWIYQANRKLTGSEKEKMNAGLRDLCEQWSAHGTPLHTSFKIEYDQFIILSVDEQQAGASGCSIDGSVRYLKSLQESLHLDFFDRTLIAFQQDGEIRLHPIPKLKSLFDNRVLSADTLSFDNTVTSKADWIERWRLPVKNSWLARYLPQSAVAG